MNVLHKLLHPVKMEVHPSFASFEPFVRRLPEAFSQTAALSTDASGSLLCLSRNELRSFEVDGVTMVVKSFRTPNLVNSLAYGFLRSSKAQRSYEYGLLLNADGIYSPAPVGYLTRRNFLLFADSYYVCLKSDCRFMYRDWAEGRKTDRSEEMLRRVARMVARMHDYGMIHKDLSSGNILFDFFEPGSSVPSDTGSELRVEVIDLNRIRFHKVGLEEGCDNFDRLPAGPAEAEIVAEEYIRARRIPAEEADKARRMIVAAMGRAGL